MSEGATASYKKRHEAIWLAIQVVSPESGFNIKSLFLDEISNSLVAIFSFESAGIMPDILQTPIVQIWWDCLREIRDLNTVPIEMPLFDIAAL